MEPMSDWTGRVKLIVSLAAIALYLLPGGGAASAATSASVPAGAGSRGGEGHRIIAILVRHAEKASEEPGDPPLSEKGIQRAEALARLLSAAGVTHLFATPYQRTGQTLAPLAAALGLEVRETEALEADQQVAAIKGLPAGSVAVVAGHSNTIPHMVRLLGGEVSGLVDGPAGPMIRDESYDRMFLVILPATVGGVPVERAQSVELRYGE
jgi:phosphohistidine phosphatase SixA